MIKHPIFTIINLNYHPLSWTIWSITLGPISVRARRLPASCWWSHSMVDLTNSWSIFWTKISSTAPSSHSPPRSGTGGRERQHCTSARPSPPVPRTGEPRSWNKTRHTYGSHRWTPLEATLDCLATGSKCFIYHLLAQIGNKRKVKVHHW